MWMNFQILSSDGLKSMVCEITLIFVKEHEWNQVKFILFKNNRNDLYHFKKSVVCLYLFVAGYW